ncbi:MAG: hypothetical protein NZ580_05660 [Bacteroidia bacterium]|nr:hypothetical protein [Bacteroidia bacterium]MDW8236049.1 hypothetical protein [Bacteroidia bacterium]
MPILIGGALWIGWLSWVKKLPLWGLSSLLAYIVGAPVEIKEVEYFFWRRDGYWNLSCRQVRVYGTLPGDSSPAACIDRLSLSGIGKKLKAITIEGATVSLLRIAPAIKNYRFFPQRGSGKESIVLSLTARQCTLDFINLPPNLHINLAIQAAESEIEIDSLHIRVRRLESFVRLSELCWRGRLPLPKRLRLQAQGTFLKKEDSWPALNLYLEGEEGKLYAQGRLIQWSQPYADFYVNVEGDYLTALLPSPLAEGIPWIEGIGRWEQNSYEVRLLSAPFRGRADLCLQGRLSDVPHITGRLYWSQYADLRIHGTSLELAVKGESFIAPLCGRFHGKWQPKVPRAYLTFFSPQSDTLHLTGWLDSAGIQGTWRRIPFTAVWDRAKGLFLKVPYAELIPLYEAIPRSPGSTRSPAFPVSVAIRHLHAGEIGDFRSVLLHLQKDSLEGEASYYREGWEPFQIRVKAEIPSLQGIGAAEAPNANLYAEYRRDTLWIWGTGILYEVIGNMAGFVPLSQRKLYLMKAQAHTRGGGIGEVSGSLTRESADIQVQGEIPVKDILNYFPISGIEVERGALGFRLCAQGAWDTILRWDNPTEGQLHLKEVKGFFPALGLPLHRCSAEVRYDPDTTHIYQLDVRAGSFHLYAQGTLQHALSYLYTDWRHLQGNVRIEVEDFVLQEVWRRKRKDTITPFVQLPTSMHLDVEASFRRTNLLGIYIDRAYVQGALHETMLSLDSVHIFYRDGEGYARSMLEVSDSACYLMGGSIRLRNLPLLPLLQELGVARLPAIKQVGLSQGRFSGRVQLSLRFTPELRWYRQSTLWLEGQVFPAVCRTPRFLRWFRPWYIAAYKDTIDFLADIESAYYTDGFLHIPNLLLLTRVAAFRIQGYHYLFPNSFLYRIQVTRLRRKAQRYADLERLTRPVLTALEQSLGLVYVERRGAKTRWYYPIRYAVNRLFSN